VLVVSLLSLLVLRLWFLQVIGGEEYERQAQVNSVRTVISDAPRGVIVDRRGDPLVMNRAGEDVVARPQEVTGRRGRQVLVRTANLLGIPPREVLATVQEALRSSPYEPVVLARDVPRSTQLYLAERRRQFLGIGLQQSYLRTYPHGTTAAQTLGYLSAIPAEREAEFRRRGYFGTERVGAAGVEARYEQYLRGRPGRSEVEVDASGEATGRGPISSTPPEPGRTLQLTIDFPVQRALENQLRERVNAAASSSGGAGVVLDARTGAVVAIASYPTYRPDVFSEGSDRELRRLFSDPDRPLLDRAIGGQYPAASTFKAITAAAGMQKGYLQAGELLNSPGELELYKTVFAGFENQAHGLLTVRTAIEVSSDTFFYQVADRFYRSGRATPLQDTARDFGLGSRTGIDLAGEVEGLIPDRDWKRRAFARSRDPLDREWKPGDSINMSIGQGNLLATPLQMAVAYAAIANGGTVVTPHIGRRILDQDGRVFRDLRPRATRKLPVSDFTLGVIKEGLYLAANGNLGTSTAVFGSLPGDARVAGKTGTAENPSGIDHSWYAGYAPYDNPRYVAVVVIEKGGTGANAAAPAVCQVFARALEFDRARCGTGAEAN
jgi:penicillin-binding protein 2